MKVLIVHPHLSFYGGAELLIEKFLDELQKKKVECGVATLSVSREFREKHKKVAFHLPPRGGKFSDAPKSTSFFSAISLLKEILALHKVIRSVSRDYDIINAHNFPTTWAAAFCGKKVVWMCNEPPELWNNPNPGLLLKLVRAVGGYIDSLLVNKTVDSIVVADSNNQKNVANRYKPPFSIVNYGIDYKFFAEARREEALSKELGLKDKFVVIQVGMITPQKNQMDTLRALKKIRQEIPQIKMVFAGRGGTDYENELKDFIKTNKLENDVVFTGQVNQEKVRSLYALSNLAVFPVKTQGGWLSPFEAISSGVPVVVYPTMGAASVISDHDLGIVSSDLRGSILKFYNKFGINHVNLSEEKKWVRENLTWQKFTEKFINIFEGLSTELRNRKI